MTHTALEMIEPKVFKKESNNILFGVLTFSFLFFPVVLHAVLGIAFSPVLSNSMKPGMSAGDLLITKEVPASLLKVGDVVVLRNGISYDLFSHRIVSIKLVGQDMEIVTKGDANPAADAGVAKVNPREMIPRAITHTPWAGRPIVYFSNHKGSLIGGFLLLTGLAFGLLRFLARRSLSDEAGKKKDHIPASGEVATFQSLQAQKSKKKDKKSKPAKNQKKAKSDKKKKKSKK